MIPPLKFAIKDVTINGEWDEANKLVLIEKLDGELVIEITFMGFPVQARGKIDTGMDNCIRVKIDSIGGISGFLIPGVLNLLKAFSSKFAKFATVDKDMLLINPGQLLPTGDMKILIQPKVYELSDQAVSSLRERILKWTEQNTGAIAKEIVDIILTLPDLVMLLIALVKDSRIRPELKLKIALCIAYVISPLDLIPEFLGGPLGFVDDAAAIGLLIASLIAEIPADLIREHWKGRPDVLEVIMQGHALAALSGKLPAGIWEKLGSLFGKAKNEAAAGKD